MGWKRDVDAVRMTRSAHKRRKIRNFENFPCKIFGLYYGDARGVGRSGRVVEGGGLENRFRESERGFESYLLRKLKDLRE